MSAGFAVIGLQPARVVARTIGLLLKNRLSGIGGFNEPKNWLCNGSALFLHRAGSRCRSGNAPCSSVRPREPSTAAGDSAGGQGRREKRFRTGTKFHQTSRNGTVAGG